MIKLRGGWNSAGKADSSRNGEEEEDELLGTGSRFRLKSGSAIVPRESVSGQALAAVVAIMAFLACLCIGATAIVSDTASGWRQEVSREVTIQIRPFEKGDMDDAVRAASRLVLTFDGISKVTALDDTSASRLLEPWLGTNLDLSELPVPKLLRVTVKDGANPDFEEIAAALAREVPGAELDDHRAWLDRLNRMARTTVAFTAAVLALILGATVLTVIFATRAAIAEGREIIDVLHFVGAKPGYIAGQFQRHFLVLAARGAIAGGIAAIGVYFVLGLWTNWARATPEADQIAALFGSFAPGWLGYFGIVAMAVAVPLLAAATSRLTVLAHVRDLEVYSRKR